MLRAEDGIFYSLLNSVCKVKPVSDKPKKKPYVPLYGTKNCTYEGNKKGRKTIEEREKYLEEIKFRTGKGNYILYFD